MVGATRSIDIRRASDPGDRMSGDSGPDTANTTRRGSRLQSIVGKIIRPHVSVRPSGSRRRADRHGTPRRPAPARRSGHAEHDRRSAATPHRSPARRHSAASRRCSPTPEPTVVCMVAGTTESQALLAATIGLQGDQGRPRMQAIVQSSSGSPSTVSPCALSISVRDGSRVVKRPRAQRAVDGTLVHATYQFDRSEENRKRNYCRECKSKSCYHCFRTNLSDSDSGGGGKA